MRVMILLESVADAGGLQRRSKQAAEAVEGGVITWDRSPESVVVPR